jgi:integrase
LSRVGYVRTPRKHVAKDGTVTWKVRFRGDAGKQTSETFRTKAKAERFASLLDLIGVEAALRTIYAEERAADAITLDQLAEQFFTWKADRVKSDRTVSDYRRDYRNWIQPTFGQRDADSITETDVQQWVEGMHGKLAAKSIADRHAILHGIFGYGAAATRKLVTSNPCIGTELPPKTKGSPKGLRPAEWQALYAALKTGCPDAADFSLFLLASGWRFSEAAALNAFAVEDWGDGPMYVSMAQVIRRNARNEHVIVEGGKSEAAERRVKLDPEAAEMVRRRLEKVKGDGLVFTNPGGNRWHYNNFLNRMWNPAVKAAQLTRRPTPHWLRHTSVAWFVMAGGVSLPEIQRRIGHEDIGTTIDTYGRMVDDVSEDALNRFAAFRNQKPKKRALEIIPDDSGGDR